MNTFKLHIAELDLPRFERSYAHHEDPVALWRAVFNTMFNSVGKSFSMKCALVGDAILGVVETDKGGRSVRKRIRAVLPTLKDGGYRLLELDAERTDDVLEAMGDGTVVVAWGRFHPKNVVR